MSVTGVWLDRDRSAECDVPHEASCPGSARWTAPLVPVESRSGVNRVHGNVYRNMSVIIGISGPCVATGIGGVGWNVYEEKPVRGLRTGLKTK